LVADFPWTLYWSYAPILKNSVATKETTTDRLFLMKDLAAVGEAMGLGAKIAEEIVSF